MFLQLKKKTSYKIMHTANHFIVTPQYIMHYESRNRL